MDGLEGGIVARVGPCHQGGEAASPCGGPRRGQAPTKTKQKRCAPLSRTGLLLLCMFAADRRAADTLREPFRLFKCACVLRCCERRVEDA